MVLLAVIHRNKSKLSAPALERSLRVFGVLLLCGALWFAYRFVDYVVSHYL